jgi:hypothetical protein
MPAKPKIGTLGILLIEAGHRPTDYAALYRTATRFSVDPDRRRKAMQELCSAGASCVLFKWGDAQVEFTTPNKRSEPCFGSGRK